MGNVDKKVLENTYLPYPLYPSRTPVMGETPSPLRLTTASYGLLRLATAGYGYGY